VRPTLGGRGPAEEGGLPYIKGMRKFLLEKIHRALRIMSDRAAFGLDGKRNYQLFCFQLNS
jgi:hypothetical protein